MSNRPSPVHGRGAQSGAVPQRFGLAAREADGDWLDERGDIDGEPAKLRTTVTEEHPKTIVTFNKSPDVPFDRSINAYRGCEQRLMVTLQRSSQVMKKITCRHAMLEI
jgi:hypothetical protein